MPTPSSPDVPAPQSQAAPKAMPGQVTTAVFPCRSAAQRVREELKRCGISPENIRLVEDAPNPSSVTVPGETGWHAFFDAQPRDETVLRQEKGIPEGRFVVGVEIDEARGAEVARLLRDCGGTDVTSVPRR